MRSQVSTLKPKRSHAGAIVAALLLTLVAGGVAVASGYFPQRDEPYGQHNTILGRHELPVYWFGPRHSFDR